MTLNKILRSVAIASVFSVLVIPFIVSHDLFFPFITGKNFFFRTMVEIGFAAWLLLSLRDASARPKMSAILWSFVAFLAAIGLANAFGENPWKSFWSNFERMEGYVGLVHVFLYFLVASSALATERLWRRFLEGSIWASVLVSLYSVFQLAGVFAINQGGVRVDAKFGNATYLAVYLIFNIFFALVVMSRDSTLWKKWTYGAAALLHVVILYYTATRGAMLGLLGGIALTALIVLIFDRGERMMRIIAGSALGAIALVAFGFLAIKDTEFVAQSPVLSRFASISIDDTRTQARGYIWPMAIEGWKERPVLGWGQENFNYIFNANYDPRMYRHEQWFDHTHNVVLDWLVAGGVVGLLAYLALFASGLYLLWRRASATPFSEKALLTGLLAAYFFHNLFVFDNVVSFVLFVSVLGLIHWKSTRLAAPAGAEAPEMDEGEIRVAGAAVLIGLALSLYFFNWRGYATSAAVIDALRATSGQRIEAQAALEAFDRAVSYDTLGQPEVMERLVDAAPRMNSAEVPLDVRQRFFELAKGAVERQLARYPDDARYELFAGNFYSLYNDPESAERHLLRAAELSPGKQSILFQLANFYVTYKRYGEARNAFRQAYELDESYTEAAQYYAAALVYAGRDTEARAFVKERFGTDDMTDDMFLRAYADLENWPKVISILRSRLAVNPRNLDDRMNLAAAYYQSGNRQAAIATIREMIALEPSFKATGEQYIKSIEAGQ